MILKITYGHRNWCYSVDHMSLPGKNVYVFHRL